MTPGPALALIEVESIARGFVVADAVVKKAPIAIIGAGAVTPGKYLLLFGGGVAEVEESFSAGKAVADSLLVDSMFLPNAHPEIVPALRGAIRGKVTGAVAIVETQTVASGIVSADAALKAAAVSLIQAVFAKGIGGKTYYAFTGKLDDVEASLAAAAAQLAPPMLLHTELITQPHGELVGSVF
jgi:microcompartment protein CcmL/EutN